MSKRQISSVLKYHGGKSQLANKLVALFPICIHLVDLYCGGLSLLFATNGGGTSEVVNDIYGRLINFWRVLQDPVLFVQFQRRCIATPFAQDQWKQAKLDLDHLDPVTAAHAFFVWNRQSRQGLNKDFATLSRNRTRRSMNEQASSWLTAIDGLQEVHERLQGVVILNEDALVVIQKQDGPNTFFYADPTYVSSSRIAKSVYAHEMSDEDHHRLVDVILNCKGKILLSGYPNEIYKRLEVAGWDTLDFHVTKSSSSQKSKPKAIERVWANYELPRNAEAA